MQDRQWRLDDAVHPFAATLSLDDVRLTTRYAEDDLDSIFSTLHEFGHGLYEANVDRALARSPLGTGVSSAVHESQSRLWENMVGRSPGFWRWCFPHLRAAMPERFGDRTWQDVHRAVNVVRPTLIRVSADEVTYGLHVILRFELEVALFEGGLDVADLPEAWAERTRAYLGLEVPDHAHGVLQDVHWAEGLFGYFPTYALGTIVSGPAVGPAEHRHPRPRRALRRRRVRAARRLARRARAPLGAPPDADRGRRARDRRPARPRPVPRVRAGEARRRISRAYRLRQQLDSAAGAAAGSVLGRR